MNNIEKFNELIKVVIKNKRFPVIYRKERNNEKNVLKFNDGTDMAMFFQVMTTKYKNKKLSIEEKILYEKLIAIKNVYQEQNQNILNKLKEAKQISIHKGYRPIRSNSNSGNLELSSKFSNGGDVGTFLHLCKIKISKGIYGENIKKAYDELINSTITYQTYIFKSKIEEIKSLIEEKNYIPVKPQKNIDKNKINTFSDGTDMGKFIARNFKEYKTNKMPKDRIKIWEDFSKYLEDFKKKAYLNKIIKMYNTVLETNNTIPWNENKDKDIYKFDDGTRMYSFIIYTRLRIKQQKASKFETWLFNKFIDFQDKFQFKLKAKEAMQSIIELEQYPNKSPKFVRKFEDGYDIGLWLRSIFKKVRDGNIEKNLLPMAEELMTLDFEEIKKWNYGYNKLKEYYETGNIINNQEDFNLNTFIEDNIRTYNSIKKSLQDEVHIEMLKSLNPNWIKDYRGEEKNHIKKLVDIKNLKY